MRSNPIMAKIFAIYLFSLFSISISFGAIIFDGSPGTNAPPATLGGQTMTPFPNNLNNNFSNFNKLPVPGSLTDSIGFSIPASRRQIGNGWGTWSHGFTGTVYYVPANEITISLPSGTSAFYFYAEPSPFQFRTIEAIGSDGTTSGPINVTGASGASYFGFYSNNPSCAISSIRIVSNDQFAIGEFAISRIFLNIPTLSQWGLVILLLSSLVLGTVSYRQRRQSTILKI